MTPYYDRDGITIYHGDCREIDLPEVSVLLTDPPYGVNYQSNHRVATPKFEALVGDDGMTAYDHLANVKWDRCSLVFLRWDRLVPVMTRLGHPRSLIVWDKMNTGMGDLGGAFAPRYESIAFYTSAGFKFPDGKRPPDLKACPRVGAAMLHPTEKPEQLIRWLLGSVGGGTVLDPFMGSGTTLVAAKQLGRKAIGIEIEEKYCEIAAKRLSQGSMMAEMEVK